MLLLHGAVIGAVVEKEALVSVVEGVAREAAVVVSDHAPATWLEDADEFGARPGEIEPVHRLRDGDQVDGLSGQAGGLGGAVHDFQLRILGLESSAGGAHFLVGLDGHDRKLGSKENFGEESGPGGDVGDLRIDGEVALAREEIDDRRRVGGPIAAVGVDASREALGGVGDHPLPSCAKPARYFNTTLTLWPSYWTSRSAFAAICGPTPWFALTRMTRKVRCCGIPG